jgi:hypothetical protein
VEHTLNYRDSYGDGWHGGTIAILGYIDPLSVEGAGDTSTFTMDSSLYTAEGVGVQLMGAATISDCGLTIDGTDGKATMPSFDYSSDDSFTLGFWFSKEACSGGPWEYVYSHGASEASILSSANPNVNAYFGCDGGQLAGDGWGTHARYIVISDSNDAQRAQPTTFDYFLQWLHGTCNFDYLTSEWVHMVASFEPYGMELTIDGMAIEPTGSDVNYQDVGVVNWAGATYAGMNVLNNGDTGIADFTEQYTGSTMATDIFIGSRVDSNEARHFSGTIAGLSILYL